MLLNPPNYLLHIFGTFKIKFPSDYAVLEGHLLANRHTTERIIEGTVYKVGAPCPKLQDADRSARERSCSGGFVVGATFASSNTTYSDTTKIGKHLKDNIFIISTMREIYEATILAHIRLVGLIDEYEDYSKVDVPIQNYRSDILAGKDHAGATDRWRLVLDETFKKFRDGLMEVYVPVDNGVVKTEYTNICALSKSAFAVVINHPSLTREYRKTDCILGTVFQDQAFFTVRRRNSGFSEKIEEPLTVELACGYSDNNPQSNSGGSVDLRFKGFAKVPFNPLRYCVTLHPNQDAVLFPVPKPTTSSFDSDTESVDIRNDIRCSIKAAFYDVSSSGDGDCTKRGEGSEDFQIIDESMLTAVVDVSAYTTGGNTTFHQELRTILDETLKFPTSFDARIEKMGAALFYTYVWGWYAGFIHMPYLSIQGLLSSSPFIVPGDVYTANENQELLRRYRLLTSLFVDEGDPRFSADHFGFLTPTEVSEKYKNNYGDRFEAYFSRVLGDFLQKVPAPFRQQ